MVTGPKTGGHAGGATAVGSPAAATAPTATPTAAFVGGLVAPPGPMALPGGAGRVPADCEETCRLIRTDDTRWQIAPRSPTLAVGTARRRPHRRD